MESNSAVSKSVPYGHACQGCSKAKCRCIIRGGPGTRCDRCNRLDKACLPSLVVRKRPQRRSAAAANATASLRAPSHLEEKLDDLVTLLKSQADRNETVVQKPTTTTPEPTCIYTAAATTTTNDSGPGSRRHSRPPPESSASSSYHSTPTTTISSSYLQPQLLPRLSPVQSEKCLTTFREWHLRSFPFIDLPESVSAHQLEVERPCLWMSIRIITCDNSAHKSQLDTNFRTYLSQRILVDAERNLDLLLGLVAWLSWMMDRNKEKKTLCLFANIASSLVFDLRLDRADGGEYPCKETNAAFAYSYPIKSKLPAPTRTNEERRAALACYCVCTCVSDFLRTQPMRWTPQMDDTLEHLSSSPEVPGDTVLVAVTRFMKVMDDLQSVSAPRFFENEAGRTPKTPLAVHVKGLLANLERVKKSVPPDVLSSKLIQSYATCAEASINELPLSYSHEPFPDTKWLDQMKPECVFACVTACKQGIDNWFALSTEECSGLSIFGAIQFARCTHILYRLSLTDDPSWDRKLVRDAVDLFDILERAAEKFYEVAKFKGLEMDDESVFLRGSVALRGAIPIWAKAFADADAAAIAARGGGGVIPPPVEDLRGLEGVVPMDFTDAGWMDLLTNWDAI